MTLGAPVVELHTGRYCELEGASAAGRARAHRRRRAALCARLGLECHAGHGLTYDDVGAGRGDPRGARAQYRPLPGRRGDLRRPGAGDPRDAPHHGRRARRREPPRDPRHRQRPLSTSGASRSRWSASATASSSASSPRSSRSGRKAGRRGRRATPSASPPRRPAPRRWAPACAAACSGATWA